MGTCRVPPEACSKLPEGVLIDFSGGLATVCDPLREGRLRSVFKHVAVQGFALPFVALVADSLHVVFGAVLVSMEVGNGLHMWLKNEVVFASLDPAWVDWTR